jgi:hypothetical protein
MAVCLGLKKGSRSFFIDAITYFSKYGAIKLKYKKVEIGSQAFDKNSLGGRVRNKGNGAESYVKEWTEVRRKGLNWCCR